MARWTSQSTHTDIGDFSTDPKLRKQLRNRRRKIAAAIVAIVAIVGFSAKPVYRAFRDAQINQNLELARQAARLEDWGEARNKARSVLLARSGDFEAFRIWTRALGHLGEPRTYLAAAMLFSDPRADRDDKLESLRIMARQAPEAVAFTAYGSLPPEIRNEREFLAALAPMLTRRGAGELVEKQLKGAEGLDGDPQARLELLRALCATPNEVRVNEARLIFRDLISSDAGDQSLEALSILGETPGGLAPGNPLPELPEWVRSVPRATTMHHLLALHPAIETAPAEADALFESAIQRFKEVDPGMLGTWLVRHDRAPQAAEMLEGPAADRADAYLSWLHALLRLGKEDELATALASPPASADLVDVALVRAAMARRRNDQPAEFGAWNEALLHAAFDNSRNRYLEVARYAATLGAADAAEDAWVAAVRVGWGPIPPYADLRQRFGGLALKGRSEDLFAMFRTLLRFEPQNPELINNYYYLGLLHQAVEPEAARSGLEKLMAEHPDRPEFASALVLAYLEKSQPEEALAHIPTLRKASGVSPMMVDALEGMARVLSGDLETGRALLAKVKWQAFMRQERSCFRRLMSRFESASLPLPAMEPGVSAEDPSLIPEWRKAIEKLEKARENDVLPALPGLELPRIELPPLREKPE